MTQTNHGRASAGGRILSSYAGLLLLAAIVLPWWSMDCLAPQYGARILRVQVTPISITGDTREIDILGHYVGMHSIHSFAPVERALAPFGMAAMALIAFALPFFKNKRIRLLAVVALVLVPIGFAIDLAAWQHYSVTHLDKDVAFSMIQNRIQTKLVGDYEVAQFRVRATFQEGFWFSVIAAFHALGFLYLERKNAIPIKIPAAAAMVVLVFMITSSQAAVLEVGESSAYVTIGAAIAEAHSGDEIRIHRGIYRERVTVDRPLVLRGESGAVVDGEGSGSVITVRSGPTEIRGLTIRGSGESLLEEDSGIKVVEAERCVITGNRISDVLFGILMINGSGAQVTANQVTGKDLPVPRRGDGIRLYNSHDARVEGNTIERSRDLSIWQSNHVSVRRNAVRTSRYGLHYMYSDDNEFQDNRFEDNQVGGAIMYSRRLLLRHNEFSGSRGAGAVGLLIKVGDDVHAEFNRFVDNTRGIVLEEAPQSLNAECVFRGNVIGGNDVGISLQPSIDRAVFTDNAILANRIQVEVMGGVIRPLRIWSESGRGNYWGEYVGFDSDRDGIGDTPHRIEEFFEGMTNRWPEVGLLRMGPAVEMLEMAARAFPVGSPRLVVQDDYPLMMPPEVLGAPSRRSIRGGMVGGGLLLSVALAAGVKMARKPIYTETQT